MAATMLEILTFKGKRCTCKFGGTLQPILHDDDCPWRVQAEIDKTKELEARSNVTTEAAWNGPRVS